MIPPLLSARLRAVAELVPQGLPMADIGTDHARLPVFLVQTAKVPLAIGCDLRGPPLLAAQRLVDTHAPAGLHGSRGQLELRQGWGTSLLLPNEVHTLTLAGMGGPLMASILATAPVGVEHLVMQPNVGGAHLRAFLRDAGWVINQERVVKDGGRLFEVFAATRGTSERLDEVDLVYGQVAKHLDLARLRERLRADERRLAAMSRRQHLESGRYALGHKLALATEALHRLEAPSANASGDPVL